MVELLFTVVAIDYAVEMEMFRADNVLTPIRKFKYRTLLGTAPNGYQEAGQPSALMWEISVRAQNWIVGWLTPTGILSSYIRSRRQISRPVIQWREMWDTIRMA